MKILVFLFAAALFFSCKRESQEIKKETRNSSLWLNATVILTNDINCRLPLLDFAEDSDKIKAFMGQPYLSYLAKDLPSHLNVRGQRLSVQIAALKPEESFACITLGPSFPALKLVKAMSRD